mgnify:CR=1 FL=1
MSKKISLMVAVMMVAVVAFSVVQISDDYDASVAESTTGQVKVYYYDGNWSSNTVNAFDLYQAISIATSGSDKLNCIVSFADGADSWKKTSGTAPYTYEEPNENYGKIATVNGSTSFSIFVYVDGSWSVANSALGWYRPFSDYEIVFPDVTTTPWSEGTDSAICANVAIVSSVVSSIPDGANGMIQPTDVDTNNSAFSYSFFIKDSTGTVSVPSDVSVTYLKEDGTWGTKNLDNSAISNGITIRGYGSDAYSALKDALYGEVSGQDTTFILNLSQYGSEYYTYYSWIDEILGYGTETLTNSDGSTTYRYWASYTSDNVYLNFNFGYYTGLSSLYESGNNFMLVYS